MKQILETPRLVLGEFTLADADSLAQVRSDAETMRFYPAGFDRAFIRPENYASRRVAEKNGMMVINEVVRVNLPHLIYAIRRDQAPGIV